MKTPALHDELRRTTERWPKAAAASVDRHVRGWVAETVAVQSQRLLATANAELANLALTRFAELLYDGAPERLFNVDPSSRILIPCPWSRTRYAAYGLTDQGSRILRSIVVTRLAQLPSKRQWLYMDGRVWCVNLRHYPTAELARQWISEFGVTAALWSTHAEAMPARGKGG